MVISKNADTISKDSVDEVRTVGLNIEMYAISVWKQENAKTADVNWLTLSSVMISTTKTAEDGTVVICTQLK